MRAVALADTERATRLEAVGAVRAAYFRARAGKALIGVASQTLANQERHLQQITGFVQAGTRPEIDLAQSRATSANARVGLIRTENDFTVARAQLNQAMGVAGDTDYDVADDGFPPVPGETGPIGPLIDEAIRARPDLAALDRQVHAQELAARAARGGYWPSLNLIGGARDEGQSIQQTPTVDNLGNAVTQGGMAWNVWGGVQLSWPVFQGLLTRGQVREADATLGRGARRARRSGQRGLGRRPAGGDRRPLRAGGAGRVGTGADRRARAPAPGRRPLHRRRRQHHRARDAELGSTTAGAQRVAAEYALATARAALVLALGRT